MPTRRLAALLGLGLLTAALAGPATAGSPDFLLHQADLEVARLTGELPADTRDWQADVGGTAVGPRAGGGGRSPAIPMLMSLVLPGAGEVYLGHKRGFLQIALDAASWYGAAHSAGKGDDKKDEYFAFADEHWFLGKLDAAYDSAYLDRPDANFDYTDVVGVGSEYFGYDGYTNIPLWVSEAADRREYYENLGKWEQFVFGWDDFTDPREFLDTTEIDIANLGDARTSRNREIYRDLRQESNDYYARRDRFIYLSVAFRVFSVLQVAYLEGLLFGDGGGGGEPSRLDVSGHEVNFFVEPVGFSRGVMGATISF